MAYKSDEQIIKKQLIKIIKNHFPNKKILKLTEITESFVNPVYSFSLDSNEQFILKFNNPRWPYKQQREIEAIIKAKSKSSVPIPNIIVFSSSESKFKYVIYDKAPGIELRKAVNSKELTSNEILNIVKKIGSYLGQLHKISFDFFGDFSSVYDLVDKTKNYLWGNRFESWTSCFEAYCLDILNWADRKSFPQYRKKLNKKIHEFMKIFPKSESPCFVHSDIQPSNIIINKNEISAIIDFEWSFAGSASFDFLLTQAGFYFSLFPTLSSSRMYKTYSDINLETIKQVFLDGYRLTNKATLKSMSSDLNDFIWLLYMIGSWEWTKQTSARNELDKYEADIHALYSRLID